MKKLIFTALLVVMCAIAGCDDGGNSVQNLSAEYTGHGVIRKICVDGHLYLTYAGKSITQVLESNGNGGIRPAMCPQAFGDGQNDTN